MYRNVSFSLVFLLRALNNHFIETTWVIKWTGNNLSLVQMISKQFYSRQICRQELALYFAKQHKYPLISRWLAQCSQVKSQVLVDHKQMCKWLSVSWKTVDIWVKNMALNLNAIVYGHLEGSTEATSRYLMLFLFFFNLKKCPLDFNCIKFCCILCTVSKTTKLSFGHKLLHTSPPTQR